MTHSAEHRYKRFGGAEGGKKSEEKKRLEIMTDWKHVSICQCGQPTGSVCLIGSLFRGGCRCEKWLQKKKIATCKVRGSVNKHNRRMKYESP